MSIETLGIFVDGKINNGCFIDAYGSEHGIAAAKRRPNGKFNFIDPSFRETMGR